MKSIVIIGSGLGGLTAGGLLAKEGYKVTILEQHNIVGGCASTFKRKGGFTCEVGLHEMDGVYSDESKKKIFDKLEVYKNVEFIRANEFFKISSNNIDFIMPDGIDKAVESLSNKFPDEKLSIKKYFDLIKIISDEFEKLNSISWWKKLLFPFIYTNIFRYKCKSVKEVMDSFIKNEELKLILNTNIGYYHDLIKNFSFLYHSIAQYSFYKGGGWYIKGGSLKLSNYLASVIIKNGGEVITNANVTKINTNNKKITSILYEHKKKEIELKSDIFISNLSQESTYKLAKLPYTENRKIASSLITIYIGFKKDLKSLYGKKAYSTFFLREANSINDYDTSIKGKITDRGFVFVDYSQIDSGLTDNDKSVASICSPSYFIDWEFLSQNKYEEKKQKILNFYIKELEKHYPNIRENIEFAEVSTPKTIQRYLKTKNGTPYGFAPNNQQFFRAPKVKSDKFDNLYFVGAWIIGGGFTPAINSGAICYNKIKDS